MKKIILSCASALLIFSFNAFANPHLDEAIKHASAAAGGGDSAAVIEHTLPALEHAMACALNAKGLVKSHTEAGIKALETGLDLAKNKKVDDAKASVNAAVEHLKEANKK